MKRPFVLLCALASPALATPKVPRDQLFELEQSPARLPPPSASAASVRDDAIALAGRVAAFERKMQFATPCGADGGAGCDLGGVIEVESGAGNAIVESDNTHEAVWDWAFYRRQGGTVDYAAATASAFDYLGRNPGWLEWQDGGGTGPDYYSLYNCGWAMRAVLEYEAATGDQAHHAYGEMCAQHVRDNALAVAQGSALLADQATSAWAASGLWLWGDAAGSAADKQQAAAIGAVNKAWLDGGSARPATTSWAASGGAVFYGVVNSYMKEHPGELAAWAQQTAPLLGGWIDESMPLARPAGQEWTDWRNAWSAWNMLAQFAAADALGGTDGDAHRAVALDIFMKLAAQDSDGDGGIPGSQQRPASEDQSWITSYLNYFGVRQVLALEPANPDGGAGDMGPAPTGNNNGGGCSLSPSGSSVAARALVIALAVALVIALALRCLRSRSRGRSA